MRWYLKALGNYANFSGRARRKEYWMFFLVHVLIIVLVSMFDVFAGTYHVETGYGLFASLYMLGMAIPVLSVTARRLHDIGKSGWMQLIGFIPIIGVIVMFVLLVLDGEPDENKYGPSPKAD